MHTAISATGCGIGITSWSTIPSSRKNRYVRVDRNSSSSATVEIATGSAAPARRSAATAGCAEDSAR